MAEKKTVTRKVVKKTEPKKVKLAAAKKTVKEAAAVAPIEKELKGNVQLNVVGLDGKVEGKVSAPARLFAAKINKVLLAQSVRVYLANQREGGAATKTRGEVRGSTRKIYRQKGTGRARHGGVRAPVFVGGGITFGPVPHEFTLKFPQKMKRAALASALTDKKEAGDMIVVTGLNTINKTKQMAELLGKIGAGKNPLMVVSKDADQAVRSARNIEGVEIMPANNLNSYIMLAHKKVVFMKEALPLMTETFVK